MANGGVGQTMTTTSSAPPRLRRRHAMLAANLSADSDDASARSIQHSTEAGVLAGWTRCLSRARADGEGEAARNDPAAA